MATKRKTNAPLVANTDPRAPLDAATFLAAAQRTVATLRDDLLARADESPGVARALRAQWKAEKEAKRTGDEWEIWRRRIVVQIAAAWVLSVVFVRVLEDRALVDRNRIAGPGATDSQEQFRALAPYLTDRDYLLTVFRELANLPGAKDLFDPAHNPVWKLGPSIEGARALLDLFRAPDAETPAFRFGQSDTRFLGDLYQNLDEETRERFALLQTPEFVERYILGRTLDRAIARFGLDGTTVIDPTCGSGHFLLGAFDQIVESRLRKEPGLDIREAARKALDAVYGADINPYAVSIARFRLTLAFLDRGGYERLAQAPAFHLHVVVGDSLLHAPVQAHLGDVAGASKEAWGGKQFALEDEAAAKDVLLRRYAAVVGNPPYITVKDPVLRERYREMYPRSAAGKYSLGAPFTERFFLLARATGFVGIITANSFMKREFGNKVIEEFLPTVNLDGVVNTSGAYIPGHSTPTVLLFGTNEPKQGDDVLTVLAKRGEPSTPEDLENGLVWRSITEHGADVGFDNDYITVARLARATLEKHPWSLGGGGAADLKELLEERRSCQLGDLAAHIGISAVTGEDDIYLLPAEGAARLGLERTRPMLIGEEIRDWGTSESQVCMFPYDAELKLEPVERFPTMARLLWRVRAVISRRKRFGTPMLERGLSWYELQELYTDKLRTPLTIAFAEVATHNHFVLDRGGKLFKQTAPIIKLTEGATEEDHLALLAYLNSSTACFWMKQVCFPKGTSNKDVGDIRGKEEANRYAFSTTALRPMPVPKFGSSSARLAELASELLGLAELRAHCDPAYVVRQAIAAQAGVTWSALQQNRMREESLRLRQVERQNEADWLIYSLVGLAGDPRVAGLDESVELKLLEAPAYKRSWRGRRGIFGHSVETFEEATLRACSDAVAEALERCVSRAVEPRGRRRLLGEQEVGTVLDRLAEVLPRLGASPEPFAAEALSTESVPFLASYRHSDAGLEKRAAWERVWDLQRAEDRGEKVSPFDSPPKYDLKDYRAATFWRLRGKLDVPKERFISYPGCESDEDKEPVYGWAGWNHLQQAIALATLYMARKHGEAWGKDRLVPMLAGLDELLPWIWQWHPEPTPESHGIRPGQYIADFLAAQCQELCVTIDHLRAWRPAAAGKRAPAKKRGPKQSTASGDEGAS